jgi:hypothetical protein
MYLRDKYSLWNFIYVFNKHWRLNIVYMLSTISKPTTSVLPHSCTRVGFVAKQPTRLWNGHGLTMSNGVGKSTNRSGTRLISIKLLRTHLYGQPGKTTWLNPMDLLSTVVFSVYCIRCCKWPEINYSLSKGNYIWCAGLKHILQNGIECTWGYEHDCISVTLKCSTHTHTLVKKRIIRNS